MHKLQAELTVTQSEIVSKSQNRQNLHLNYISLPSGITKCTHL